MNRLSLVVVIASGLLGGSAVALAQPQDGRLGIDAPSPPLPASTPSLAHSTLPVTHDGNYVLDPAQAKELYGTGLFGVVTRTVGGIPSHVRDQHYPLERDSSGVPTRVGLRMIPVSDPHVPLRAGEQPDPKKPGSHLIDRLLRSTQGLKESDPIFALAVYLTPEGSPASWARRALDEHTHVSVYLGQGLTRSSPETYHNHEWQVRGYPATVQVVSMAGTDQATLNRNGLIASSILNPGVVYPSGPKPDHAITLGRTLAFYRGWLTDDPHTTTIETSSAEHVAIVTNVMLNVPHNASAFSELWGAEGPALLSLAKAKFQRATGTALVETTFEPLWKKDRIRNPTARTSLGYRAMRQGLAWAPEDAIDRLENGLDLFASWPKLGAEAAAESLLHLAAATAAQVHRSGQLPEELEGALIRFVTAVIPQMFVHEAMTKRSLAELSAYASRANADLYTQLGGRPQDLVAGGSPNRQRMAIVSAIRRALEQNRKEIVRHAKAKTSVKRAYALFQRAIEGDLRALQRAYRKRGRTRSAATSGITHRVATGLHPGHAKVKIEAIATVFEAEELTTKKELESRLRAGRVVSKGGKGLGLTDAMKNANGAKGDEVDAIRR